MAAGAAGGPGVDAGRTRVLVLLIAVGLSVVVLSVASVRRGCWGADGGAEARPSGATGVCAPLARGGPHPLN
ncbi:hypothetical protein SCMC78_28300 [Streptomyces sp. CMC78]|uniref:Uncharacterized protein n=1 Tax=Streptomyces sp. CMC78 TaxID=3231512 RepID=A0AB33KCZ8_9ACTN